MVSTYLAWETRAGNFLNAAPSSTHFLSEQLTCEQCHQALRTRMRDAMVQWASVKVVQANHDYDDFSQDQNTIFSWILIAIAFGTLHTRYNGT